MEIEIKYNSPLQYLDYDVSKYIYENYIFSNESKQKYNLIIKQLQNITQEYKLIKRIENNRFLNRGVIYINFLSLFRDRKYKKCYKCNFKCSQVSHLFAHLEYRHKIIYF